MSATFVPIRGGSPRAVLRRARTMLELEAAVEREAARLIDLAREFGASEDDIVAALDGRACGPTDQLEQELYRMDSRIRAAERQAQRARDEMQRATATLASSPRAREDRHTLMLELFTAGIGVREIARRVGLSPATVHHHRKRWAAERSTVG